MKKIVVSIVGTLVVLAVAGLVTVYSGVFNVAADAADPVGLDWLLSTARESSVERRAEAIRVPDFDEAMARSGFGHYREMCVGCHGAPGVRRGDAARGLNPSPPDLSHGEADTPHLRETFWIVKHGIKMTGMPAFGTTHDDGRIWELVAFVRELRQGLGPEEYGRMVQDAEAKAGPQAGTPGDDVDADGDARSSGS